MYHTPTKTQRALHEIERLMLTTPGVIALIVTWVILVMGLLVFVVDLWAFL